MLLGGLWHGAGLNFILWGLIHGVGLIINHYNKNYFQIKINKYISIFCTFNFVSIAWIFFRADNIDKGINIFTHLFIINDFTPKIFRVDNLDSWLTLFILSLIIVFFCPNSNRFYEKYIRKYRIIKYILVLLLIISIFCLDQSNEFIYYEF